MRLVILTALVIFSCQLFAVDIYKLDANLKQFAPFVNKTWFSEKFNPETGKHWRDVSHWQIILDGKAIRVSHSVNDGEYAGESTLFWDEQAKTIRFFYVTNANFYTQGTGYFEDGNLVAIEKVSQVEQGVAKGISEVKSVSELTRSNKMTVTTYYKKQGKWGEPEKREYRIAEY